MNIKQFLMRSLGWKSEPAPLPPAKKPPYYFNDINRLCFADWSLEATFKEGIDGYKGHLFTFGPTFNTSERTVPRVGDIWVKKTEHGPVFLEFTQVTFCRDPDDMYFYKAKQIFPETVPISLFAEVAKERGGLKQ